MITVKRKQVDENPFFGKKALFDLFQKGTTGKGVSEPTFKATLTNAWREAKDQRELLEVFYSIAFSIGDISNRQHNVLGTAKVDNGGEAHRVMFQWFLEWLKANDIDQYYRFVESDIIRQYTTLDNVIGTRIKTTKGKTTIEDEWNALDKVDIFKIASYLAKIIKKGSLVDKVTIAKFLSNVRTTKRQKRNRKTGELVKGGRPLQPKTLALMKKRAELYTALSNIMAWPYDGNTFSGLAKWKAEFNGGLESKLFSTGKIREYKEQEFLELLNNAPSGARDRIRRRLLTKDNKSKGKWPDAFCEWFLNWEKSKEKAQEEQRILTEKVRQGIADEGDKKRLQDVKKEAKVNTGGENLFSMLEKFLKGSTDDLLIQSILDKVTFEVPVLVVKDVSGSMMCQNGIPDKIASFLATVTMLKNPSTDCDNMVWVFGDSADVITDKSKGHWKPNRFMTGSEITVNTLVDRTRPFSFNLNNVSTVTRNRNEGTSVDSIARSVEQWIKSTSDISEQEYRKEWVSKYPVFLIVSDGCFNNASSAPQSIAQFQQRMRQICGWEGVVVVWDVDISNSTTQNFEGMDNVIHYNGWNLGVVNTIFSKIHDLDVIDVYTPLKSLWLSNRYELVRKNVI